MSCLFYLIINCRKTMSWLENIQECDCFYYLKIVSINFKWTWQSYCVFLVNCFCSCVWMTYLTWNVYHFLQPSSISDDEIICDFTGKLRQWEEEASNNPKFKSTKLLSSVPLYNFIILLWMNYPCILIKTIITLCTRSYLSHQCEIFLSVLFSYSMINCFTSPATLPIAYRHVTIPPILINSFLDLVHDFSYHCVCLLFFKENIFEQIVYICTLTFSSPRSHSYNTQNS